MMRSRNLLLTLVLLTSATFLQAQAPRTIYSYAVGNWRNGPVVEISPLFQTTEQFTTPQLIAQVRERWPMAFTDTTDIDIQRFATKEEGDQSRTTLKAKYGIRHLPVDMMEEAPPIAAPSSAADGPKQ